MTAPQPFTVEVPQRVLDGIREKVRAYQWPRTPSIAPNEDPWTYGTDPAWLRELCRYWTEGFDWRAAEAELNRFPQFTAQVDGQSIHFLHVRASAPGAPTVVLTHGWPGSVYEFYGVIERLTRPENHGGNAAHGVNVVVPSLPGYGFSGAPDRPIGPRRVAQLWDRLLREVLGYETYIAQGGDWGAMVSGWLAFEHSTSNRGGCRALHLNMLGLQPATGPQTDEEKAWQQHMRTLMAAESGYMHEQSTKPVSLSYAMADSPVGAAAWILEKFNTWADTTAEGHAEHIENAFSKDQLLINVMIYLVTGSFGAATWLYRGAADEDSRRMPDGARVSVPTAVANFPGEFMPWPPRSLVERGYNVVRWTDMDRGGHFAAFEEPEVFANDLLEFARQVRD